MIESSSRLDRLTGSIDLARWRSPIRLGLSAVGVAMLILVYSVPGPGFDFYAYWAVDPQDPYRIADGLGAFHYAPPDCSPQVIATRRAPCPATFTHLLTGDRKHFGPYFSSGLPTSSAPRSGARPAKPSFTVGMNTPASAALPIGFS